MKRNNVNKKTIINNYIRIAKYLKYQVLNFINYLINIFRTVQFVRNSLLIKLSVNYFLPPLVNRLKETLFR